MAIPFHLLLQRALLAQRKTSRPWMEALELSPGQPKILYYLAETGGCIQRELASICAIEPATVSKLLDSLELRGLIQRESTGSCKRSVMVRLTSQGAQLQQQVRQLYGKIEDRGRRNFSPQEWNQFREFLERLYVNFSEPESEESDPDLRQ